MKQIDFVSKLPDSPAVYALMGGRGRAKYVAYVGQARKLRRRVDQHLVKRDSSVAVGTSATGINPDHITHVRWWEHDLFNDHDVLRVAEMIASEILNPALRSRGGRPAEADILIGNKTFLQEMQVLFNGEPTGRLEVHTLQEVVERLVELEDRIASLEKAQ